MPADPKHPLFGRRGFGEGPHDEGHPPPTSQEDVRQVRERLETARQYVAQAERLGQSYAYFQSAQAANRALKQARKALDDALRAM